MLRTTADRIALLLCFLFVLSGLPWIEEVGLQNDEVLFAGGIYPPFSERPQWMLMTYVGALKSFLYRPIFYVWPPSPASVRIPALVLAGLTIWLFYLLVKRTLGPRTGLFATALLASDTSFLLTSRWDWGPVVLQHLCLVAGMLSIVRFTESRQYLWLGLGFFTFGLGLWDKALFGWSLVGLGAAATVVFPKRLLSLLNVRSVAIAVAASVLGAGPLIRFNLSHRWATFRDNAAWSTEHLGYKFDALRVSLDASALIGPVIRAEWDGPIRKPDDDFKRALIRLSDALGNPQRNAQFWLLVLAVVLSPLILRTSHGTAFLFSVVYLTVTWLQMALTKDAGGSIHHAVLLWPLPHLAMAAVFSQVRWGSITLLACILNLACTAAIYRNMLLNGGVPAWSDAITPALADLASMRPQRACALDWGFFEPIRLVHKGRIVPCFPDPADTDAARRLIADSQVAYIAHTKGVEFNPGDAEKFVAFAVAEGYGKVAERIIYDYNGRPMIEIFRLQKRQLQ